jgi:hypothetical protein
MSQTSCRCRTEKPCAGLHRSLFVGNRFLGDASGWFELKENSQRRPESQTGCNRETQAKIRQGNHAEKAELKQ